MIRRALRLAVTAGLVAAGVAAGRQHERVRPFGTSFWRAEAQLALHLYDAPRLVGIQSRAESAAGRHRLEDLVARSGRRLTPKS